MRDIVRQGQLYGYTLAEHEFRLVVPEAMTDDNEIILCLSAHGGGTVGRAYGNGNGWDYAVYHCGQLVVEGRDLRSPAGRPVTHFESAQALCAFLANDAESLTYGAPSASRTMELDGTYSPAGLAFLVAEGERLGMVACMTPAVVSHRPDGYTVILGWHEDAV